MRMWMVDPRILCRKHLLGEYNELHKHRHVFVKQHKIDGYIKNNCIEPMHMKRRHDQLAHEMEWRGYNHKSNYEQPDISYLPDHQQYYRVNVPNALKDLLDRCEHCRKKYNYFMNNIYPD